MVLKHTVEHIQIITAHAQQTYPEECCGLLIGKIDRFRSPEVRLLLEVWQTQNTWDRESAAAMAELMSTSPDQAKQDQVNQDNLTKTRRYWIDPKEILEAQRYARQQNLEIIGIYHSHPDHPAVPSECDRVVAWSNYSYVIVSVVQGKAKELLCWCLDEQIQFQAEEMRIGI